MKRTFAEEWQAAEENLHQIGRIIYEHTPLLQWIEKMVDRFGRWLENRKG